MDRSKQTVRRVLRAVVPIAPADDRTCFLPRYLRNGASVRGARADLLIPAVRSVESTLPVGRAVPAPAGDSASPVYAAGVARADADGLKAPGRRDKRCCIAPAPTIDTHWYGVGQCAAINIPCADREIRACGRRCYTLGSQPPADDGAGWSNRASVAAARVDRLKRSRRRLCLTGRVVAPAKRLAGLAERANVSVADADRAKTPIGGGRCLRTVAPADDAQRFGDRAGARCPNAERQKAAGWRDPAAVSVASPTADLGGLGERAALRDPDGDRPEPTGGWAGLFRPVQPPADDCARCPDCANRLRSSADRDELARWRLFFWAVAAEA